jgi:hypothetical protein
LEEALAGLLFDSRAKEVVDWGVIMRRVAAVSADAVDLLTK